MSQSRHIAIIMVASAKFRVLINSWRSVRAVDSVSFNYGRGGSLAQTTAMYLRCEVSRFLSRSFRISDQYLVYLSTKALWFVQIHTLSVYHKRLSKGIMSFFPSRANTAGENSFLSNIYKAAASLHLVVWALSLATCAILRSNGIRCEQTLEQNGGRSYKNKWT